MDLLRCNLHMRVNGGNIYQLGQMSPANIPFFGLIDGGYILEIGLLII